MKKRLLFLIIIFLSTIVGQSSAQDSFFVVPTIKNKYAPVPKTGQTTSYATRDDGALQKGVASPSPRFTDNGNGTVTDNLTKLIWMKNANAIGSVLWSQALTIANSLKSGQYGLTDGSQVGDWRLPNVKELASLLDYGKYNPALPAGHPFLGVQSDIYWTSSIAASNTSTAWTIDFYAGFVPQVGISESTIPAWCVRGPVGR
jgi:hypothetical protein